MVISIPTPKTMALENRGHKEIEAGLGITPYFCDPHASHGKRVRLIKYSKWSEPNAYQKVWIFALYHPEDYTSSRTQSTTTDAE
jgi:hypothetical protein